MLNFRLFRAIIDKVSHRIFTLIKMCKTKGKGIDSIKRKETYMAKYTLMKTEGRAKRASLRQYTERPDSCIYECGNSRCH